MKRTWISHGQQLLAWAGFAVAALRGEWLVALVFGVAVCAVALERIADRSPVRQVWNIKDSTVELRNDAEESA